MRRLTSILVPALTAFLLLAPVALANDHGEGLYGETDDKVVTNAGFIIIAFFPLLALVLSLLQARLEKRKYARRAAVKARQTRSRGGW